jgi:WD40 repeat protein
MQRNGALSPDGKWLAAPGEAEDGARRAVPIQVWNCATGEKVREFGGAPYVAVQISSDGKTLAAMREEATVELWDFRFGRLLRTWQTHASKDTTSLFATARFSANGKILVTWNDHDRIVTVWEVATGNKLREFTDVRANNALAISPDGTVVAVDETDQTAKPNAVGSSPTSLPKANAAAELPESHIRLLDVATGKELRQLVVTRRKEAGGRRARGFDGAVFSADGKMLAAGGPDWFVLVWEVATAREVRRWPLQRTMPWTVCFSPDGSRLAIGGASVRLFDVATGNETEAPPGHDGMVALLAFLSDGRTALTQAGAEHTVHLWDTATGKEQKQWALPAEWNPVAVAFHEDMLIAAGRDRDLWTLSATTGKPVRHLRLDLPDFGPNLSGIVPSPDGKVLALRGLGKPVVIIDSTSGKERLRLECHAPPLRRRVCAGW